MSGYGRKAAEYARRIAPVIFAAVGAGGTITAAVLAAKAQPKAEKLIREAKQNKGKELNQLETTLAAAPAYIPCAVACAVSISCAVGAAVLNKKAQISLAGACALLNQSYKEYKAAAKSVFGEEADKAIIAEQAQVTYITNLGSIEPTSTLDPDYEYDTNQKLFYDSFSRRYFNSTMTDVINAEYHANRNLSLRGYLPLNEFYSFLGIEQVKGGDEVGWTADHLYDFTDECWLDFDNHYAVLEDDMECYIISTVVDIEYMYEDDGHN